MPPLISDGPFLYREPAHPSLLLPYPQRVPFGGPTAEASAAANVDPNPPYVMARPGMFDPRPYELEIWYHLTALYEFLGAARYTVGLCADEGRKKIPYVMYNMERPPTPEVLAELMASGRRWVSRWVDGSVADRMEDVRKFMLDDVAQARLAMLDRGETFSIIRRMFSAITLCMFLPVEYTLYRWAGDLYSFFMRDTTGDGRLTVTLEGITFAPRRVVTDLFSKFAPELKNRKRAPCTKSEQTCTESVIAKLVGDASDVEVIECQAHSEQIMAHLRRERLAGNTGSAFVDNMAAKSRRVQRKLALSRAAAARAAAEVAAGVAAGAGAGSGSGGGDGDGEQRDGDGEQPVSEQPDPTSTAATVPSCASLGFNRINDSHKLFWTPSLLSASWRFDPYALTSLPTSYATYERLVYMPGSRNYGSLQPGLAAPTTNLQFYTPLSPHDLSARHGDVQLVYGSNSHTLSHDERVLQLSRMAANPPDADEVARRSFGITNTVSGRVGTTRVVCEVQERAIVNSVAVTEISRPGHLSPGFNVDYSMGAATLFSGAMRKAVDVRTSPLCPGPLRRVDMPSAGVIAWPANLVVGWPQRAYGGTGQVGKLFSYATSFQPAEEGHHPQEYLWRYCWNFECWEDVLSVPIPRPPPRNLLQFGAARALYWEQLAQAVRVRALSEREKMAREDRLSAEVRKEELSTLTPEQRAARRGNLLKRCSGIGAGEEAHRTLLRKLMRPEQPSMGGERGGGVYRGCKKRSLPSKISDAMEADPLLRMASDVTHHTAQPIHTRINSALAMFSVYLPETRRFFSMPHQLARALIFRFPQHYPPETTDVLALARRIMEQKMRFDGPPDAVRMLRRLWVMFMPIR